MDVGSVGSFLVIKGSLVWPETSVYLIATIGDACMYDIALPMLFVSIGVVQSFSKIPLGG